MNGKKDHLWVRIIELMKCSQLDWSSNESDNKDGLSKKSKFSLGLSTYQRTDWAKEVVAIRCSRTWRPCRLNAGPSGRCRLFSDQCPGYPAQHVGRWMVGQRSLLLRCLLHKLGRKIPIGAYVFNVQVNKIKWLLTWIYLNNVLNS